MTEVLLTEEQARIVAQAVEPVVLRAPDGMELGRIEPLLSPDEIAELKRRAASPGPWFTSAQVRAHMQALQEEWDRTGGFDEAYMRDFLRRLREADPGHMRLTKE